MFFPSKIQKLPTVNRYAYGALIFADLDAAGKMSPILLPQKYHQNAFGNLRRRDW